MVKILALALLAALAAPAAAQTVPVASLPAAPVPDEVAAQAPPPPDYALPASWASGPAGPGASASLPVGASPAASRAPVDVFFVHPTTSRSATLWNEDIANAEANRWVDASTIARQASVFGGCCRIFAPRYRAATYKALMNNTHRDPAFELAYGDVERAFVWYMANQNHGRPFIIAGHSQGALHIANLLQRRIDGTPWQRQMVGAWIIGINLAEGEFGLKYKQVQPCDTPAQTGCVLQWNSILPSADLATAASRSQSTFVAKYGDVPGKLTLCINPLTFDRAKPAAPASAAKGAVPGAPGFGPLAPLRPHAVAARCDSGMLVVEPAAGLGLDPLPGGVMHYHDYGLFYADIRANANLRVKAFLKHYKPRP